MRAWFATFLSTDSGKSDTMLTLSVFGVLSFVIYGGWALIRLHQPWDAMSYGTGLGAAIGAAAAGMGIRSKMNGG
ncbi:MAG: hypothetical protein POG24_08035 [Acidocella sp.]|nr:hypothetical protein [Acidocella sp.]